MMVHCGNACSMAKVGTNGEVYAVLMEGNVKEAEEAAVPLRAGRKSGRPDGPCRRLPNCLGWSLLLTVTATCITVLAFQLWATWHLQQKVLTLQAQVDSISALDLEELRSQLRDLYDLRDLTSSDRDADIETAGLRGHPTSADEDQEDDPYAEHLLAGFASVGDEAGASEAEQITEKSAADDDSVEMDDTASDEDADEEETDDSGEDEEDPDDKQSNMKSQARQQAEKAGRSRRQADLSSHTQDGIPIFDRGYGVAYNRTEGLRIYQSLLATGGRGEPRSPDVNWDITDAPIQPHHRQNSFWRGKKEKPRHQPVKSTTNVPTGGEVVTEPVRSSTPSPARSAVEFRHSRVKSSGEVSSTPSPVQGDQKSWPTSRPSGAANAIPEAAAKPAVHRGRQYSAGAAKVSQPAVVSRYAAGVQATADKGNSEEVSANHPKKRVNKKTLREVPHIATAVHLVADSRNGSSVLDNQVEVASRNELGLHTSWKPASWQSAHRTASLVKIDGATLTVKQNGLYLIYAQVHYLDEHAVNAYEIFVNTEPFLRCVTTSQSADVQASLTSSPKANTCYTAGATQLREGDKLFLRDVEPMRYSVLQPSKTFFGLIRLAPISEYP